MAFLTSTCVDSISLDPRNDRVWQEAALKIFQGKLGSIFIECSYDRSQPDEHLYGHLSPVHMMTELALLAEGVEALRHKERSERLKRKRQPSNDDLLEEHGRTSPRPAKRRSEGDIFSESLCPRTPPPFTNMRRESNVSPRSTPLPSISAPPPIITTTTTTTDFRKDWVQPLKGLQIVVTHVKDTMSGEDIPSKVLADLEALEEKEKLGVTFLMAEQGLGLYL